MRVGDEGLAEAVVATGFAPNEQSLRPMVRGISAVGARARTVRMLGSAAIMLAWVVRAMGWNRLPFMHAFAPSPTLVRQTV